MDQISVFNFESNEVRTTINDGEIWFVAKDVAEALGYAKSRNAVSTHVDLEDKKDALIQGSLGGGQTMTTINESGVYSLIFGSKLESAKRFKKWVTSEVLPSIRKTGGYEIPKTYAGVLQLAANQALLIEQQDQQLKIQAPKVDFFNKAAESNHLINATQVAQNVGNLSARALNKILETLNVYNMSVKRGRAFKQWFIDKGYGALVQTEGGFPQALFTVKGEQWIFEQLNRPKAA